MRKVNLFVKLGVLAVAICTIKPVFAQYEVVNSTYQSIHVNAIYAGTDTVISAFIDPYRVEIQKEMNVVIATSEFPIEAGKPEGTLNNLVADAVYKMGKMKYKNKNDGEIDFCLLNYGGLRKGLPKGEIMLGNVFELMPFDNKLSVLTLKGEQIVELFDFLAKKIEGHPISNCSIVVEQNVATHVLIDGKQIDKSRSYKVVTNDYLQNGNDGMFFFKNAIKVEEMDYLIRDAIVDYIKLIGVKPLRIENDGRYTVKN